MNNPTISGFANIDELAQLKTMFCIQDVRIVEQKNGITKWYLTIGYTDGGQYVEHYLTFFYHTKSGKKNERNYKMFNPLLQQSALPIHNAFVTSSYKTYYKDGEQHSFTDYSLDWLKDGNALPCECKERNDDGTAA